ncbi:MAG: HDIG domain-containing protein [Actinobacteria bacterium]|nr:HDIG domain-containing protein [Actinomycetota bacterium]
MRRSTMVRAAIFLATVTATWGVLSLGTTLGADTLQPDTPAPMTFTAQRDRTVIDQEETARQEELARESVEPVRQRDLEVEASVSDAIEGVFDQAQSLATDPEPSPADIPVPELPTTTTTAPAEGTTTSTEPPAPALISGRVFLDPDRNGVFDPGSGAERSDVGLARVGVEVETYEDTFVVQTDTEGLWSAQVTGGAAVISVDGDDPAIPQGWVAAGDEVNRLVECAPGDDCTAGDIAFVPNLRPVDEIVTALQLDYPALSPETIAYLAAAASEDVIRSAYREQNKIGVLRENALLQASAEFRELIEPGDDLEEVRARLRTTPQPVFYLGEQDPQGTEAVGEIVANFILPNNLIDDEETQARQEAAAAEVEDVTVTYLEDQEIVREGVLMTRLDIDAIQATRSGVTEQASLGLLSLIAVLVALLGLYLSRFRPEFWARPRMVALLGILVLLAAAAVRGAEALQEATTWYVLPAVAFGFMTAILFDQRIAVLMALALGVLTAAGTLDSGVTVYASLAAMAPIPFVSSVSTRGAFRNAVVLSSLAAAAIAASTAWFFHAVPTSGDTGVVVGTSLAWAFGISVLASLVALAALQFFESAFDITTTLSLLDLTDRNHEALQLIQERAFGTFNHSLMVGTLADAAARAIGANPLLARAMAYYHDLGKTENPTYFIENQFGIPNPHDMLEPKESAEIIRSHVTDGVRLAAEHNIPSEVTQGIVSHHGDGVMRYFYEKAREMYGEEVEVEDYRHIGHKPRTAEAAIIMLADSLEAACRAVFQTQEPSPDAIEKVVDRIVNEKLDDGQLSESPITLAELSKVRQAFLDSLKGHYHQRIAYPNFPGT